jgi:hypothetical protein
LRKSHVLPEFLYRFAYDDKHRFLLVPSLRSGMKPSIQQLGLREPLFCADCETRLSVYEGYASKVFVDYATMPHTADAKRIIYHGVDYTKFKLFQLSVLWRASLSSLETYGAVRLGPHDKRLRDMIWHGDPGSVLDYPCSYVASFLQPEGFSRRIVPPHSKRIDGHRTYWFVFGGIFAIYYVSSHTTALAGAEDAFLTRNGDFPIWTDTDHDLLPFMVAYIRHVSDLTKRHRPTDRTKPGKSSTGW